MLKHIFNTCAGIICLISLCALDSASWIPTIIFVLSGAYLVYAAYRGGWMYCGGGADD